MSAVNSKGAGRNPAKSMWKTLAETDKGCFRRNYQKVRSDSRRSLIAQGPKAPQSYPGRLVMQPHRRLDRPAGIPLQGTKDSQGTKRAHFGRPLSKRKNLTPRKRKPSMRRDKKGKGLFPRVGRSNTRTSSWPAEAAIPRTSTLRSHVPVGGTLESSAAGGVIVRLIRGLNDVVRSC